MTLKRELEDSQSPIRAWLATHMPGLPKAMRSSWVAAMPAACVVPTPTGQPADVLGHAISERIVWEYTPLAGRATRTVHGSGLLSSRGASKAFIDQLNAVASSRANGDQARTARTACVLGLLDRATRTGLTDETWYVPLLAAKNLDEALASVPAEWAADVATVADLALPQLAHLTGHVIAGPVFAGSNLVDGADADLIIGNTLVEIKAIKPRELKLRDLQQVVAYALLDTDDKYQLSNIAILSARYGTLVTWQLDEIISEASQHQLSLKEARQRMSSSL